MNARLGGWAALGLLLLLGGLQLSNASAGLVGGQRQKNRDPAYRQEYVQVRDARLNAVLCQQHVHKAAKEVEQQQCAYLRSAVAALKGLGFASIKVHDCTALHHNQHHHHVGGAKSINSTTALPVCEGIQYEEVRASGGGGGGERVDVFLLLGDSFVPTFLVGDAHHQQQQQQMRGTSSPQQSPRTRLYLHTGNSQHMKVLLAAAAVAARPHRQQHHHGMSAREAHVAVRNIGLYDHILFVSEADRAAYADLMNPLFSYPAAGAAASGAGGGGGGQQHSASGHPTLASIPPRLQALSPSSSSSSISSNQSHVAPPEMQQALERAIIDAVLGAPFLSFVRSRLGFLRATVVLDHPRHRDEGVGVFGHTPPTTPTSTTPTSATTTDPLVALIIEPRLEGSFEFCVRNVLSHLGDAWALHVHHSKTNERFVRHVLHDVAPDRVKFVALPEPFADSGAYNQYLKSAAFWADLAAQRVEHVLIFQSDSLMLEPPSAAGPRLKLSHFLQYSFVGAPWHLTAGAESADWLRAMQKKKLLLDGVGNGGFSLRNVSAMLHVASTHRSKNPSVNEDVFFLQYLPQYAGVKLPTRREAYNFAREVPCDDLDGGGGSGGDSVSAAATPLAVHSAWAYFNNTQAQHFFSLAFVPA